MTTQPQHSNKRRWERIDAKIKVQFRSDREFATCYTQNLSKGGIYLETSDLPDPNAVIELDMELPASPTRGAVQSITIRGKVARLMTTAVDSKTIHKVAIQFVELEPHIQMQIDKLFEELSAKK